MACDINRYRQLVDTDNSENGRMLLIKDLKCLITAIINIVGNINIMEIYSKYYKYNL